MTDHPITPIQLHAGQLGLCACPGGMRAFLGRPRPEPGIDALARWPARAVVSLMESREFEVLGLEQLPGQFRERFPLWLHLPIRDGDTPGPDWMERWKIARLVIAALLAEGHNVALHCLAGVGRTGTVAAMCLVDAGFGDGGDALGHVRSIHTVHAAETPEQEAFVEDYRPADVLEPDFVHDRLAEVASDAGLDSIFDASGCLDPARTGRLL